MPSESERKALIFQRVLSKERRKEAIRTKLGCVKSRQERELPQDLRRRRCGFRLLHFDRAQVREEGGQDTDGWKKRANLVHKINAR